MPKAKQYAELFDPRTLLSKINYLLESRLWLQIIAAMVLGVGLGLLLAPSGVGLLDGETAATVAEWVALPGGVFLSLIQMVVIPLVTTSIVLGLTSAGDKDFLARVGLRIAPYFVGTTAVAVVIGALMVTAIEPGAYVDSTLIAGLKEAGGVATSAASESESSIPQQLTALIPANPLAAQLDQAMLQIVVLAIISGVVLLTMPESQAQPLLLLADSVQQATMKVVSWAMALAPLAVFGLLCDITLRIGFDAIIGMGVYVGTVLLGLLCLLGFYLVLVAVFGRRNPLRFLAAIRECQLLAFSTSSSAAVMPLSMKTAETELEVDRPIAQFIIPLGATINMDGTALYQVSAALFLAQVYGVELSLAATVTMMVTTIGASIGSPSTPGVGIVILGTILSGIGIPPGGIALIIGVDRILDMSRTAVNVSGDLTACVVMNRWLAGTEVQPSEDDSRSDP
ncbi:MAG: dicarboxylate/amino acid:cation symporter [Enhygromyxa sp.]